MRGRLATLGVGALRRAELPVPADARCRDSAFSHDGRHLFALCDSGGEVEVWRFAVNGSGTPVQVTRDADTLRTGLFPSPDGRWLAHTDQEGRLSLTALAADGSGGASRVIERALTGVADPRMRSIGPLGRGPHRQSQPADTPARDRIRLFDASLT